MGGRIAHRPRNEPAVLAGGLAVNASGYLRFTRHVAVVLQLSPENIISAFAALGKLGYRPIVPVTAADFADPAKRSAWVRDKHMTVLSFWSESHRATRSPMHSDDEGAIDWSLTTWEGAEREQLRRWACLSLEEIVRAQEEMQRLADSLGSQP
jgi:hypothetical protein